MNHGVLSPTDIELAPDTQQITLEPLLDHEAALKAQRVFQLMLRSQRRNETISQQEALAPVWQEWTDVATILQPRWEWPKPQERHGRLHLYPPLMSVRTNLRATDDPLVTDPVRIDLKFLLGKADTQRQLEYASDIEIPLDTSYAAYRSRFVSRFCSMIEADGSFLYIGNPDDMLRAELEAERATRLALFKCTVTPAAIQYSLVDLDRRETDTGCRTIKGIIDPVGVPTKYDVLDDVDTFKQLLRRQERPQQYQYEGSSGALLRLIAPELTAQKARLAADSEGRAKVLDAIRQTATYRARMAKLNAC